MAEITLTDENFEQNVLKNANKVVVDFWAPWCGPCQIMAPILEDFAKTAPANVSVGKLNVDESPQIAQKFNIMSIPTIILFEAGKPIKHAIGVQSRESLEELIK